MACFRYCARSCASICPVCRSRECSRWVLIDWLLLLEEELVNYASDDNRKVRRANKSLWFTHIVYEFFCVCVLLWVDLLITVSVFLLIPFTLSPGHGASRPSPAATLRSDDAAAAGHRLQSRAESEASGRRTGHLDRRNDHAARTS